MDNLCESVKMDLLKKITYVLSPCILMYGMIKIFAVQFMRLVFDSHNSHNY